MPPRRHRPSPGSCPNWRLRSQEWSPCPPQRPWKGWSSHMSWHANATHLGHQIRNKGSGTAKSQRSGLFQVEKAFWMWPQKQILGFFGGTQISREVQNFVAYGGFFSAKKWPPISGFQGASLPISSRYNNIPMIVGIYWSYLGHTVWYSQFSLALDWVVRWIFTSNACGKWLSWKWSRPIWSRVGTTWYYEETSHNLSKNPKNHRWALWCPPSHGGLSKKMSLEFHCFIDQPVGVQVGLVDRVHSST